MSSRLPIVAKRKASRARRRGDFRRREAPIYVGLIEMGESIARLARYDYSPLPPDSRRLASVMSRWGMST